jgi:hypothetical protein
MIKGTNPAHMPALDTAFACRSQFSSQAVGDVPAPSESSALLCDSGDDYSLCSHLRSAQGQASYPTAAVQEIMSLSKVSYNGNLPPALLHDCSSHDYLVV